MQLPVQSLPVKTEFDSQLTPDSQLVGTDQLPPGHTPFCGEAKLKFPEVKMPHFLCCSESMLPH